MLLWRVAGVLLLLFYHLNLIEAATSVPTAPPSAYPSLSPSTTFVITTIAGTGSSGFSGDNGQATSATLNSPRGVALDSSEGKYYTPCDL